MDATLKRRMWKVAIVHFVLSVLVIYLFGKFVLVGQGVYGDMKFQLLSERSAVCRFFLSPPLVVLQPLMCLANKRWPEMVMAGGAPVWVVPLCMASIPVWSICFGWIVVCGRDWLNHFPTLGRKIF